MTQPGLHLGQLRAIYDLVPLGILVCSLDGLIRHSNRRAQELLDQTASELLGCSLPSLSDGDTLEVALGALSCEGETAALNRRISRGVGIEVFCRLVLTRVQGDVVVVTLEDITEVVQRQMRLAQQLQDTQDSEARTRQANMAINAIIMSLPEAINVVDLSGNALFTNDVARSLLGDPDISTGPGFLQRGVYQEDTITLIAREDRPLSRALRGEHVTDHLSFRRNPGRPEGFWCLASAAPFKIEGELFGAVAIHRDVTPLVRQRKALEESNADLERFAAVASHDLQEPPRQIAAYSERALQKFRGEVPERLVTYLETINRSAVRMQALVSDILTYSRVGHSEGPFVPVDLANTLAEALDSLAIVITEKGAVIDSSHLPVVEGDPSQLYMLLRNLLSNALKFAKPGQPPRVEIRHEVVGSNLAITVVDHGIGFDPQYRDVIFEVFRRLVGKSEYPGTGIGLSLCRKIARHHKGDISASSTPGVGSSFTVVLPVKTGQGQPEEHPP